MSRIGEATGLTTIARRFAAVANVPIDQWSRPVMRSLLVSVHAEGGADANAVRRAIVQAEPGLPFIRIRDMSSIIDEQLQPWRLGATLFALFGVLGLVVAALGLYSVVAHDVAQRSHEIGVRLALGARRTDVARLIVGRGLGQALLGVGFGLTLAALVTRRFADLLFETPPNDPFIYGGVAVLLLLVAGAATLVPARRAAKVEPVEALRGGVGGQPYADRGRRKTQRSDGGLPSDLLYGERPSPRSTSPRRQRLGFGVRRLVPKGRADAASGCMCGREKRRGTLVPRQPSTLSSLPSPRNPQTRLVA